MFWVVAYCSEYAPSARLSLRLRVLRARSLGATGDRCLVTVTPEHPTSPVLPEVRKKNHSRWNRRGLAGVHYPGDSQRRISPHKRQFQLGGHTTWTAPRCLPFRLEPSTEGWHAATTQVGDPPPRLALAPMGQSRFLGSSKLNHRRFFGGELARG